MKKAKITALLLVASMTASAQLMEIETKQLGKVSGIKVENIDRNYGSFLSISLGRESKVVSYSEIERLLVDTKKMLDGTDFPPSTKQEKSITHDGLKLVAFSRGNEWNYLFKINDRFKPLTRSDMYRLMDLLSDGIR